jgi:pre-mRNA-processing factor 6
MADSVSGQTVVDPKGYLTSLGSVRVSSAAEVSDIKKARTLLRSVTSTNPGHAPGWVAAARLEEVAGNLAEARRLAGRGCELCPGSEDVWLEASRLQATTPAARSVLARGVAALPRSVRLWLQAARLEAPDTGAQSRVLRKALERIPDSVRLWKAAVELAPEADARVLLARAVECCPQHTELWLALAKLETYANAQKVLNRARLAVPTDRAIWIAAAKLEEAAGKGGAVPGRIIARGLASLAANGVEADREAWLAEAEAAEKATPPFPATARAIVASVVGLGVEEEDRERTWLADAAEAAGRGCPVTARAILAAATEAFPAKPGVWRRAAELERASGDREALDALLRRAVTYCPQVRRRRRGREGRGWMGWGLAWALTRGGPGKEEGR